VTLGTTGAPTTGCVYNWVPARSGCRTLYVDLFQIFHFNRRTMGNPPVLVNKKAEE
jgi:hypothetical protein